MSYTYTVNITQSSRQGQWIFDVVYGGKRISWGVAVTRWGARRKAKHAIKDHRFLLGSPNKESYEVKA